MTDIQFDRIRLTPRWIQRRVRLALETLMELGCNFLRPMLAFPRRGWLLVCISYFFEKGCGGTARHGDICLDLTCRSAIQKFKLGN